MMNKTDKMTTMTYHQNKKRKVKKSKVKHINKWKHSDLPDNDDFKWNLPIPALDSHESPSSLFEKILTDRYITIYL